MTACTSPKGGGADRQTYISDLQFKDSTFTTGTTFTTVTTVITVMTVITVTPITIVANYTEGQKNYCPTHSLLLAIFEGP